MGGDLWAGGLRANVPGPGHGAADRSVSLLLVGDRVVIHCFAGDDWRAVQAELVDLALVDGRGRLLGGARGGAVRTEALPRTLRTAAARALWDEGRPPDGTLSERHMRLRGLVGPPPDDLRHHPAVAASIYAGEGPRRPALLAAIRDPSGELQGVEVTYLAPNGWRARVRTPRKTVGSCPAGSAVRLFAPGPRLLVGEGVFTCLAAARWFRLPAWALLSTRNLRAWRPPPGVRFVLIAADRGADGERSARALASGLGDAGVGWALRLPPAPSGDWDEAAAAARAAEEGEGRVRAGAADGWSGSPARRPAP
ncbi:MAG: virulence-associated protein E [Phenylobacterium zucineum]|nr:MAG: virulence-associated protein E [Phenylobacterium zucineum]